MRRRGYTLVELVIAMSMVTVVMTGIYGVLTTMVRFQVEGVRKNAVVGWSIASGLTMMRDLEDANVLAYPTAASGPSDYVRVCQNWSRHAGTPPDGGPLDATMSVKMVTYCYDGQPNGRIRRDVQQGVGQTCPSGAPAACVGEVLAVGVNRAGTQMVFSRDDITRGVRARFTVGTMAAYAGPTAGKPDVTSQQFQDMELGLSMNRVYSNAND